MSPEGHDDFPPDAARTEIEIPGHRILYLLGEGGMGKVYLARDTALGRLVAIKIISESALSGEQAHARFLREARLMATVEHAHIVRVYALGQVHDRPYLVVEYVPGETLARRLWRQERLAIDESLRIAQQCLRALAAAWERGIVHRDIKPSNILLDELDRVRVADFGLARSAQAPDEITLSGGGAVLGTPYYASPEQARRGESVDFRSDIFSLGIVLFEMLSGERPFQGQTPLEIVQKTAAEPLPDLRSRRAEVPESVAALLEWMTRKSPDQRPGSYAELGEQLQELRGSGTTSGIDQVQQREEELPAFLARCEGEEPERPPVVARERELTRLGEMLQRARRGHGSVVLVSGEAGTGKTALVDEFARRALRSHDDVVVASAGCRASTGPSNPHGPFRALLGLLTGDVEASLLDRALSHEQGLRLWRLLPLTARTLLEAGPWLVGTFLPAEALVRRVVQAAGHGADCVERLQTHVERIAARPAAPGPPRELLFEQYLRLLHHLAKQAPLVLVIDDLHWADGDSLALLDELSRSLAASRLLVVGTYRGAEIALGRDGARHPFEPVLNEIERLFGESAVALPQAGDRLFVDSLIDSEPNRLGPEFRQALFAHTSGHALFTVELLRTMQERGMLLNDNEGRWIEGMPLDWQTVPVRVDAVIRERVDRATPELRRILTAASVEGEGFTAEAVARVVGLPARVVVSQLSEQLDRRHRLVRAEGFQRRESSRLSRYRFTHVLFQRHLYEELDEAEKAYLHEDLGTALASMHAGHEDEVATELARHFCEGGAVDKAIEYLALAGHVATRLSAHEEALARFSEALELLDTLPASPQRAEREVALLLALAPAIANARGWASEALGRASARALELTRQLDASPQLCDALTLLGGFQGVAGALPVGREMTGEALDIARRLHDPVREFGARLQLGIALLLSGRFVDAREQFGQVGDNYDPDRPDLYRDCGGTITPAAALAWNCTALRILGHFDQAARSIDQACQIIRRLDHLPTAGIVWTFLVLRYLEYGDLDRARTAQHELAELASRSGQPDWLALATHFDGTLLVEEGRVEEGRARMRAGFESAQAFGRAPAFALRDFAAACAKAGFVEEGFDVIRLGLGYAEQDERYVEAELHRVHAELWRARGGASAAAEAEAAYRRALDVARRQQAKAWEIRAAIGLAELLSSQGKQTDARQLLADTYSWFTEGFATRDLRRARALLDSWAL